VLTRNHDPDCWLAGCVKESGGGCSIARLGGYR
jgi:hypothetical protein